MSGIGAVHAKVAGQVGLVDYSEAPDSVSQELHGLTSGPVEAKAAATEGDGFDLGSIL